MKEQVTAGQWAWVLASVPAWRERRRGLWVLVIVVVLGSTYAMMVGSEGWSGGGGGRLPLLVDDLGVGRPGCVG